MSIETRLVALAQAIGADIKTLFDNKASHVPGVIQMYGGVAPPAGWLLCDGAAVSRSMYAELFAAIGTAYGAGDGSTTFNLPDLSGRVARGAPPGSTGGANSVTLAVNQMPAHNHSPVLKVVNQTGFVTPQIGSVIGKGGGSQANIYIAPGAVPDITIAGVSEATVGGSTPIDITPAYTGVAFIIRAAP